MQHVNEDETAIEITLNGRRFSGTYEIVNGTIYVHYLNRTKPTQLGGTPALGLARIILAEMVREAGK